MPMTDLTPQTIIRTGLAPTYGAANVDGHSIPNAGRMFLHVKNGSAVSVTVTVDTPGQVDGLDVAQLAVAIAAGLERMIGPFPPGVYNQISGKIHVTFSAVTTVTLAAFIL
uniref:Uncharacterized protein n=1 Tax=viral metagenome TaxID=1070528 RepID=A0A6H1ZEH9_9ZZZZ